MLIIITNASSSIVFRYLKLLDIQNDLPFVTRSHDGDMAVYEVLHGNLFSVVANLPVVHLQSR